MSEKRIDSADIEEAHRSRGDRRSQLIKETG
jgi:hypothetical protein